jgi:hypothetical protein
MRAGWIAALSLAALTLAIGCGRLFGREYEYEEQLYLAVDGSATLTVDASVPALIALRGFALDSSPRALLDPARVRQLYESPACHVTRVPRPWYRHGRRFVQIQMQIDDVRQLGSCAPLNWSTYSFQRRDGQIWFAQRMGPAANGNPGAANWSGDELMAVKLHLPSKILFHNARRLSDHTPIEPERGNIVTWEQKLTDRRAGAPIDIQVQMEEQSILYRTLWMFVGSFAAAVVVLVLLIAWTIRKGKRRHEVVRHVHGQHLRGPDDRARPANH